MARDLILLVADKNIEFGVRGPLGRPAALGIGPIEFDMFVYARRDPGCVHGSVDFLRQFVREYHHALVILDRVGSGREVLSRDELASQVRGGIATSGWGERGEVIVLDPELEAWVFGPSRQVEECLGWPSNRSSLRAWLERRGFWARERAKPAEPRRALEIVLREVRRPRSSALYQRIAKRVSVRSWTDPAFVKLRTTLAAWFPPMGLA